MQADETIITLQKLDLDPNASRSPPPSLEVVEEIIGYKFGNKQLLKEAFMHPSYKADECQSYKRLEYLGDSVLNLLITNQHYFWYPEMAPGALTRLRAANVDNEALARVALKHDLHKFLRHQMPLFDERIQEFMEGVDEYPMHSHGMIDPPKVLADIVESLVGAIFVDNNSSMDATCKVVEHFLQPITPKNLKLHPVAKLNEACQKIGLEPQAKDLWDNTGEIEIFIGSELVGRGQYKLKKMIATRSRTFLRHGVKGGHIGCLIECNLYLGV